MTRALHPLDLGDEVRIFYGWRCPNMAKHAERALGDIRRLERPCDDCYMIEVRTRTLPYDDHLTRTTNAANPVLEHQRVPDRSTK